MAWLLGVMVLLVLIVGSCPADAAEPSDLEALLRERLASQVEVEFYVQREDDRLSYTPTGLVLDDAGLIILEPGAIPSDAPVAWIKDITVYLMDRPPIPYRAVYLGESKVRGHSFLRVEEKARPFLVPVTRWGSASVRLGQEVWGFGTQGRTKDNRPSLLLSRVNARVTKGERIFSTQQPAGASGGAVYDLQGCFVGWGLGSFSRSYELRIQEETLLVDLSQRYVADEISEAADFFRHLEKAPDAPQPGEYPWLGFGLINDVPEDTVEYLNLSQDRSAFVINDITAGSPAAQAGMRVGDIVIGYEGAPLPRLRPHDALVHWFCYQYLQRQPGDVVRFEIWRAGATQEMSLTLGRQPKGVRWAERRHFKELDLSIRELVHDDVQARRRSWLDYRGVFVCFVRANSRPAEAGLVYGDWIEEIDGKPVQGFAQASEMLQALAGSQRTEYTLLVSRDEGTTLLRVPLRSGSPQP